MKPSTTDHIEGTIHQAKGIVKEKIGQVTNDPDLTTEGRVEQIGGHIQKKIGDVEQVLER